MPNHYTTRLTIKGPKEQLDAFKAKHIVEKQFDDESGTAFQFDFNTVIPQPAVLENTFKGSGEEAHPQNLKAQAECGFSNWYDWACENWGTKWNSYTLHIKPRRNGTLAFSFQTAWAPPVPVLEKLIEMWPSLEFNAEGRDEDERRFTSLMA